MKKLLSVIFSILFFSKAIFSQKASDVLENGINVNADKKIFLQLDNGTVKYSTALSLTDEAHPPDFTPLDDSAIFLVHKNAVNIYLAPPLNPLNFSYNIETKEIPDPIDEAAATALGTIIDQLTKIRQTPGPSAVPSGCITKFNGLIDTVTSLQKELADDYKKQINAVFTGLKSLDFIDEIQTKDSIDLIKKDINKIEKRFSDLQDRIKNANDIIKDTTNCNSNSDAVYFAIKSEFSNIIKAITDVKNEQEKRLKNLNKALALVKKVQASASTVATGLKWCIKLPWAPSVEGKIALYTFSVNESGYKLSADGEIVSIENKEIVKRTIRVRRFQRFVPEVSVGTAYTFFKYNTYGTTSDSAGVHTDNLFVASPTENLVRNINISTMINFNYFIPNSPVHPFYQLGLGINTGMPTFLTGIGIRSNINGLKRLAVAGGKAMTWIKELDKLKVGDKISGTDDIDKDLKFQFTKPAWYIGLQYNF